MERNFTLSISFQTRNIAVKSNEEQSNFSKSNQRLIGDSFEAKSAILYKCILTEFVLVKTKGTKTISTFAVPNGVWGFTSVNKKS